MKCQEDIETLSNSKLEDAECLFNNDRFDSAFYLAGYVIELLLKAKVCKTLAIPDFFDTKFKIKNPENIYKSYKVHDYEQLLLLSGIYIEFKYELENNADFKYHWSVVSKWSEEIRY
ncbi:MAG: hypothetical protein ACR2FN_05485 [Chitinophagaceae bacterium]